MSFDFQNFNHVAGLVGGLQRHQQIGQNQQILEALKESNRRSTPSGPQCPECGGFISSGFGTCQHCNTKLSWIESIPCLPGQEDKARAQLKAARKEDERNRLAAQVTMERDARETAWVTGCFGVVCAIVVLGCIWWVWGDGIGPWFSFRWGQFTTGLSGVFSVVGRVGPAVLAIGVGGGLIFFLWKKRSGLYSWFLGLGDGDDDDEPPDNRIVFQTLLRSLCCMMAADGKIVADEEKAAKRVLELVESPLSESEVTTAFVEFRERIGSSGFERELQATVESIRATLADENFRDTFRRVLKRIAEADGTIDTQEKQAAKLMMDAMSS